MLERYVGATPSSSSTAALLSWLCAEIREARALQDMELPKDAKQVCPLCTASSVGGRRRGCACVRAQLAEDFPEWLEAGARAGPLLLLIDGLSSLGERAPRAQVLVGEHTVRRLQAPEARTCPGFPTRCHPVFVWGCDRGRPPLNARAQV